ncbi:MAG: HEAT repeat domain-containing protein [Elainellaceae cyanobacterium]
MSNVLKQAQTAVQEENWALLNRCLQQLLPRHETLASERPSATHQDAEIETLLMSSIQALELGDFQSRWDIAKVMSNFGSAAIAPLLELLENNDDDWELTWFIARILGESQHPDAIAALINLLKTSTNEDLIAVTGAALANIGKPAVDRIVELVNDTSTRLPAVRALAQIQHPQVPQTMLTVVEDDNPLIRAIAISTLSHIHESYVPPVLVRALRDVAAEVRQAAVVGLGLQAHDLNEAAIISWLSPLLWDININVRRQAAISLGRVGTPAAVAALADGLRSPYTPLTVSIEIVGVLGWIGTPSALSQLVEHLELNSTETASPPESNMRENSDYRTVCNEIFTVLGRVEPEASKPSASQILIDALVTHHPAAQSPHTRQAIALSLGYLGQPHAIDTLIHLLADIDAGVRLHAIAALKHIDADQVLPHLRHLSTDTTLDSALQAGIANALQEWNV